MLGLRGQGWLNLRCGQPRSHQPLPLAGRPVRRLGGYPLIYPPSSDSATITVAALAGLRRVYRPGYSYKKAGVVLLEIAPADRVQPDLFTSTPDPRRGRVMAVMDHINREYGRGTLRLASEKLHSGWAMQQEKRSPRWTT